MKEILECLPNCCHSNLTTGNKETEKWWASINVGRMVETDSKKEKRVEYKIGETRR
jgi:hypothetical protein